MLKTDARFCQYFIYKFKLNVEIDNTPEHLKSATNDAKRDYLHKRVCEALKDMLSYFEASTYESLNLDIKLRDHPLQGGRLNSAQYNNENASSNQSFQEHDLDKTTLIANGTPPIDKGQRKGSREVICSWLFTTTFPSVNF